VSNLQEDPLVAVVQFLVDPPGRMVEALVEVLVEELVQELELVSVVE
tara:strand:- start:20 stop:160 length:141 start_codon:yes stop_codon:yes gene_type:complete